MSEKETRLSSNTSTTRKRVNLDTRGRFVLVFTRWRLVLVFTRWRFVLVFARWRLVLLVFTRWRTLSPIPQFVKMWGDFALSEYCSERLGRREAESIAVLEAAVV
jgi:hypothetical protein